MPQLPCHVRLEAWEPELGRWVFVPDGTRVQLLDANRVWGDELLDEGLTVGGTVELIAPAGRDERTPDLYLRADFHPDQYDYLPWKWDSRCWFAVDGTPGHLPDYGGEGLGSAALPVCFRLGFGVFARLVRFDAAAGRWRSIGPGHVVELVEVDTTGELVVDAARTDGDGAVALFQRERASTGPALFLRMRRGEAREGVPEQWDSRKAFEIHAPDGAGVFRDVALAGLGHPDQPLVFDVGNTGATVVHGNHVEPIIDGVDLLAQLEAALAGAQETVHLEMMLFFDDDAGQRITDALVAAAARGVRVRIILDVGTTRDIHLLVHAERFWARFLRTMPDDERAALLARYDEIAPQEEARGRIDGLVERLSSTPGITVLDSSFGRVELAPGLPDDVPGAYRALEAALPALTLARVDHRKMLIVDGQLALLGGQNVGDEYLYTEPFDPDLTAEEEPWHKWHDVFVSVQGPIVAEVQRLFRERWFSELGHEAPALLESEARAFPVQKLVPAWPEDGLTCRLLRTTPGAVHEVEAVLLERFAAAQRQIWVANPYFSAQQALHALCAAARRGVRVVFVLPDHHNDSVDFLYAGRVVYDQLIAAGVEVYEYQGRMTHAKCFVVDDVAIVGSANLNRSSFRSHYEVALMVKDAAWTERFRRRLFEVDLERSQRIRAEDVAGLLDIVEVAKWYVRTVVWTQF